MKRGVNIGSIGAAALMLCVHHASAAECEIISATHSAPTKGEALLMSQALAVKSANELKAKKGWRAISMTPERVKPDPFWKNVRRAVPEDVVYASFVTARIYSICFTGVVVKYACTSGAKVCPK